MICARESSLKDKNNWDNKTIFHNAPLADEKSTTGKIKGQALSDQTRAAEYSGHTESGESCELGMGRNGFYNISWENSKAAPGERYSSCGFNSKTTLVKANLLKVSGGSDFSVCKAKIIFDNNGNPIEADLGIGTLFKFGYDVTCLDLKLQK